MPTQPVVLASKVNLMVSPFTAYVILYRPFDENLVPEHSPENRYCKIGVIVCTCMHVYMTLSLTSAHDSSIHAV